MYTRTDRFAPLALIAAAGFTAAVGAVLPMRPGATILAVALGLVYVWILLNWRRGVAALVVVLPFAGVPAFLSGSQYALIARDVAITVPIYSSLLFAAVLGRERLGLKRTWLASVISLFALVVALQVLVAPSALVGLIGAKIWLFYIPMIGVGFLYVRSTADALQLLKITTLLAVVPAALGIVEWAIASRTGTLGPFSRLYGSLRDSVSGQSVMTSEVRFSRIPSTFTSVSQYASFSYVALTTGLAVALVERTTRWLVVVAIIGLAALTSGARAAFLIVPLLTLLGILLSGFRVRRMVLALLVSGTMIGALVVHGASIREYRHELSVVAAVDSAHSVREFERSLEKDVFGDGTGSHANAALRYGGGDVGQMVENWYARAGAELGVPGLALAVVLLISVAVAARGACRRLTGAPKEIGGPIAALAVMTALISFKSSILDIDPFNVYFWLFVGVLLKLATIEVDEQEKDAGYG
jgi:hypothetical protein